MSEAADDLSARVNTAIGEWLAAEGGGMVAGFALMVDFYEADGERSWATAHGPDATLSTTLGLVDFHRLTVERQVHDYLGGEDL